MSGPRRLLPTIWEAIASETEAFPAQISGRRADDGRSRHIPYALPPSPGPIEAGGRRRDEARLLVSSRFDGTDTDTTFSALPDFLDPGDVLVVNTSATLPAAIPVGHHEAMEGDGGLLLHVAGELPGGLRLVELRRR
ncbi:MAG: S-adenosylmethionine:tRNA ribosyltransferase-isomerase, partial [Acidimicrobiia bacterium]